MNDKESYLAEMMIMSACQEAGSRLRSDKVGRQG
jgi:hypothetical protein